MWVMLRLTLCGGILRSDTVGLLQCLKLLCQRANELVPHSTTSVPVAALGLRLNSCTFFPGIAKWKTIGMLFRGTCPSHMAPYRSCKWPLASWFFSSLLILSHFNIQDAFIKEAGAASRRVGEVDRSDGFSVCHSSELKKTRSDLYVPPGMFDACNNQNAFYPCNMCKRYHCRGFNLSA